MNPKTPVNDGDDQGFCMDALTTMLASSNPCLDCGTTTTSMSGVMGKAYTQRCTVLVNLSLLKP